MQVHNNPAQLPAIKNPVVTIGTFDGVHLGHRQIIDTLRQEAVAAGGESVIVTFHPHPRKVVHSAILGVRLINTMEEKLELLKELKVDHVVIVPFTDAFANQPAEEYVRDFLAGFLKPHTIIIGYDHRFGRDRTGNYELLEKLAPELGFRLKEIPRQMLDESAISSTRIRKALLNGELELANQLLGYSFFFSGTVVHGDKLGRELGYPTANLRQDDEEKIIPADGIYAVYASLHSQPAIRYRGMMSIGFRPTVDGSKRVTEVNLFDFNQEIYGQTLRVYVQKFLRPEKKFDSLEALTRQIDQDKADSLKVLE